MESPDIYQLLNEIIALLQGYDEKRKLNRLDFNIFRVMNLSSYEVPMCRFLTELLDPRGRHGIGNFFLKRFLTQFIGADIADDGKLNRAKVWREYVIDGNRRIDIFIDLPDIAIPIEVKIYAADQNEQCDDYYRFASVNGKKAVKLLYLTLDGHEPSEQSKGSLEKHNYRCISFEKDILDWLNVCLKDLETAAIPEIVCILVRQYKQAIEYITGKDTEGVRMEIQKAIGNSAESARAASEIAKAFPVVAGGLMLRFFLRINELMEKEGYHNVSVNLKEKTEKYYLQSGSTYPQLKYEIPDISYNDMKFYLALEIDHRLYYGITTEHGKRIDSANDEAIRTFVKDRLNPENIHNETADWFWWKLLWDEEQYNFRNFNENYFKLFDETHMEKTATACACELLAFVKTVQEGY